MIKKKLCLLGSFSVGKTSLVRRYVENLFSDKYLTTVGVRIDKKDLQVGDQDARLMIWDLHGDDELQRIRESYLRGSHGALMVVDPCRPSTLDRVVDLRSRFDEALDGLPILLLQNKVDLMEDWRVPEERWQELREQGWQILPTSAKTGEGVEEAFQALAASMLGSKA